ncbi:hypothetical protein JTB14_004356 [Gonioctena quinquepunctata]|nr:hypothetical protein JTB14_004356 [Gonioctena quinquepunctata]
MIKELIPNIGTRVRFTECFKKYFGETETSFNQTYNVENIDISCSDIIPEEKEVQSESSNSTTSMSSGKERFLQLKFNCCERKIGGSAKITTFTEEDVESQRFLRTRSEPWDEIVHHWYETYHLRRTESERSLSLFLTKWPILEDPRAASLIDCDFDRLFPDRWLNFFGNWEKFFK